MKLDGYPELLAEFLASRRMTPYEFGINDCATFAADCLLYITGTDPLAPWRSNLWSNGEEAGAALDAAGGLVAAVDNIFPRVPRALAQRGDLCLVKDSADQPSLAICAGSVAVSPGFDGQVHSPMRDARLVWRT